MNNIARSLIGLSLSLAAVTLTLGQQSDLVASLSPVPPYPVNGVISDDQKDKFVFVDQGSGDIVISYPDEQLPGKRKVLRAGRHNLAEPLVTSTVTPQGGGGYVYRYSVKNGESARRGLRKLSISVGASAAKMVGKHPVWTVVAMQAPGNLPGSIRPQALLSFEGGSAEALSKGQSMGGFEVSSEYRPGLVIAYAESSSDNELVDSVRRGLPQAVQEQLSWVMNPDWDSSQAMTIGPKFDASDPKPLIVMDFHANLSRLAVLGPLTSDSPFIRAALVALTTYMSTSDTATLDLSFLDKAAPGLESEIAAAMRISLK